MQIKKNEVNKIFTLFLFAHLIVWTLLPSLLNTNLPLDTIEAIAWGNGWPLGWDKHPPLSSWFPELFYQIFGNQDWAFYLLSQIFVVLSFVIVFIFSKDFFKDPKYSLISVLLLEGILFYNFTTPEFNVNVCPLPFWALTVYYFWKGLKQNDIIVWLLFGLFAAFGILSKYLFVYLLVAIDFFFIYLIINKKFNPKCLISLISFIIVLSPHFFWLVENDYVTFTYAFHRTGVEEKEFLDHIYNPLIFLGKQLGIVIPFFLLFILTVHKPNIKFNFKDKKFVFLFVVNILPIILMFLTSVFMGAKLRTMWMTPFYLFMGVFLVYTFKNKIVLSKLKYFLSIFLILFIFSPAAYFYISITQTDKRTDFPGKQYAKQIQKAWDEKYNSKINYVLGDEWWGGNLSYHLKSRPKWVPLSDKETAVQLLNYKKNLNAVVIGYSAHLIGDE